MSVPALGNSFFGECYVEKPLQLASVRRCGTYGVMHLQIQDRMDIIQLALDTNATACKDAGRLAMLAEQLGISERHAEITMRQARSACKAGDLATANELVLHLARQQHIPAWTLAVEVSFQICNAPCVVSLLHQI